MKFVSHRNKLTLSSVILLSYIARLKNEVIEIQTRTMSREQAVSSSHYRALQRSQSREDPRN
jgi:hypothetical protein